MKTKTIANWQSRTSIAEEFKTENWIFRGVGDARYELMPKIGRPDISKNPSDGSNVGYSPDFEKRCIERFKREARSHMGIEPASHLDWLSIAQHYGLPTRLLDWTESPLMAAYFALKPGGSIGLEHKDAGIYGLPWPTIIATSKVP